MTALNRLETSTVKTAVRRLRAGENAADVLHLLERAATSPVVWTRETVNRTIDLTALEEARP